MELQIMYPPQKDSPTTFLMGAISSTDTFAIVGNVQLLPSNLPFPLTLGPDKPITEVVMVTEIDTENNRIVFERGSGALPWVAGTTVGRVFNASDLKTLQDNIIGINQEVEKAKDDILDLEEDVSDLVEVVGDPEGGLVKDLEDEIVRATNAEAAEVLRATTAEGTLETKKVDRADLPQVLTDTSYSADATKLTNTLTRYNASNKATTTYDRFIPLITPESVGLMTPEAYNEISALRNDVSALQQQGGRFIGLSFATKAALDGYEVPDSVKAGDFTYVLDDEDHDDVTTKYVFDGNKFDFAFVVNYDPVGLATSEIAGLVKSTDGTPLGKVFVETDGTMSVVGWDALNTNVNSKVPNSRKINSKTLTEDISLSASDVGAESTSVNATLSTTWSGTGPYTQDVAISGMTSTKNATVGLASTATEAQRAAARNAIFNVTDQTANQITITADGEKPTITIPISVILMP